MKNLGPDINELLRQSFLELDQSNPANDQILDAASQQVFSKNWSLNSTATAAASSKNKWFSSPWFFGLGGLTLVVLLSAAFYFYSGNPQVKNTSVVSPFGSQANKKLTATNHSNTKKYDQSNQIPNAYANNDAENPKTDVVEQILKPPTLPVVDNQGVSQTGANNSNFNQSLPDDHSTSVPSVSPFFDKTLLMSSDLSKSQMRTEKQKLVMNLTADITTHLPLIPGAQGPYNDKSFQVPFYMWPSEITVGEYMLFLNDLIQEGKQDEYNLARPRLDVGYGAKLSDSDRSFFKQYFTDSAYANHPMVFISSDGAYLYCYWLQKLIQSNTDGSKTVVVRLPNKGEWERAASGGNPEFIFGTKSGHLVSGVLHSHAEANFKQTQKITFDFVDAPSAGSTESQFKKSIKKNFFTTRVRSYPANAYQLYDMSGNVSEMVTDRSGKVIVKGGNWNSNEEFLRIRDDDFNEFPVGAFACPFIGFRPVINIK